MQPTAELTLPLQTTVVKDKAILAMQLMCYPLPAGRVLLMQIIFLHKPSGTLIVTDCACFCCVDLMWML